MKPQKKKLRPYNIEKINVLTIVHNLLQKILVRENENNMLFIA